MRKILVLLFVLSLANLALADDLRWPEWRGQWSTTVQWWDFPTGDMGQPGGPGVIPDGPGPLVEDPAGGVYLEPGYLPSTMLWVDPLGDYIPQDLEGSGRLGIWPLSGIIEVVVDNHDPQNEKKIVWLQLTWQEQNPGAGDLPIITPLPQAGYQTAPVTLVDGIHEDLGFGWIHSVYTWEIRPNPVDERFLIEGNINVDQIVIDTWCIPEPATLGLLLVSGPFILRRRR